MATLDELTLQLSKMCFALSRENLGNLLPLFFLDLMVGIDKAETQLTRDPSPNGGFTHPHEADEVEIEIGLFGIAQVVDIAEASKSGANKK